MVLVKLITKVYPSLIDIYPYVPLVNDETGEVEPGWDYQNPVTVLCNISSLQPDNSLEQFGSEYTKKIYVKIEYATNKITLRHQAGNLRSKNGRDKYYAVDDALMIFNVSGVNTQIDQLGNLVCHVAYLEYYATLDANEVAH